MDVPVLLIVFNRPETTKQVLELLEKVQPTKLYIAADGPRPSHPTDAERSALVKTLVKSINWNCDVKYLFHEKNLGCSVGPRSAFDWFFSFEESGIILEDDCLPDPSFFPFCKEMLQRYKNDKSIISINGSNLGYQLGNGDSYCFSRFMNMWGWATWRDRAEKIDYEIEEWKHQPNKKIWLWRKLRYNLLDIDLGWLDYWHYQFEKTIYAKKVTWWDYQWIFHQLNNNLLSVVPATNLVTNIGFNEHGHHTLSGDQPASNIPIKPLNFPLQHPDEVKADLEYEERFVKGIWCDHKRKSVLTYSRYQVPKRLRNFVSGSKHSY